MTSYFANLRGHDLGDLSVQHLSSGYFRIYSKLWGNRPWDISDKTGLEIEQPDGRKIAIGADVLKHFALEEQKQSGSPLNLAKHDRSLKEKNVVAYDVQSHTQKWGWIGGDNFVAVGSSDRDTLGVVLEQGKHVKGTFHSKGGPDTLKFAGPKGNYRIEPVEVNAANSEKHQKVTYIGSDKFDYGLEVDVYGDVELAFVAPLKYVTHTGSLIDYWPAT